MILALLLRQLAVCRIDHESYTPIPTFFEPRRPLSTGARLVPSRKNFLSNVERLQSPDHPWPWHPPSYIEARPFVRRHAHNFGGVGVARPSRLCH